MLYLCSRFERRTLWLKQFQKGIEEIYSHIGQYFGEREILTFGHFGDSLSTAYPPDIHR